MSTRERIAQELEKAAQTIRTTDISKDQFLTNLHALAKDVKKDLKEAWAATEEVAEAVAKDFKAGCKEVENSIKETRKR